ncbi:cytochrome P450 [Pholiota molesta]|nr:cytochrome P450 [Pholiota molesta]
MSASARVTGVYLQASCDSFDKYINHGLRLYRSLSFRHHRSSSSLTRMNHLEGTHLAMNALMAYTTHLWMKHYDPLPLGHVIVVLLFVPNISAYATIRMSEDLSLFRIVSTSYITFSSILATCVVAYRLSTSHPLAKYPGPKIMKATKLWGAWIGYTGKTHEYLKRLHDEYGPTIRIGPNELSTIEKEFIPQILGGQGMPKGPLWDGRRFSQLVSETHQQYDSLIVLRDSALHDQLRKPWNQAFAAEPLQRYETQLLARVIQLNHILKKVAETSTGRAGHVDITKWIDRFSFDFMGDFALGGVFESMRAGDSHDIQLMEDGIFLISITQHMPWIANFLRSLPIINSGMQRFIKFGAEHGLKRANTKTNKKDLFSYIAESLGSELPIIISNALLAIVAGSDTVATAMSSAIYFLLANPEKYKRLQTEIDAAFDEHEIPDIISSSKKTPKHYSDVLGRLSYLNAVINESLRLYPPVATSLQRAPAKGSGGKLLKGNTVADIYLPEGNSINVPPYVIHRDPRYFSPHPNSFLPERWLSSTIANDTLENTITRDAFIPFSSGPQNCVGRPLALMEMRYALSSLVRNFHMEFDTSACDPKTWEEQFCDRFLLAKGKISIILMVRNKVRGSNHNT